MQQAKFSLTDDQAAFVNQFAVLGYPDRSSLVREAIDRLRREVTQERLRESATLYAEVYAEDEGLRQLTEQALEGWLE
jgi:Arc/MetJ-type ribon-helix-helix transcriptional regulator